MLARDRFALPWFALLLACGLVFAGCQDDLAPTPHDAAIAADGATQDQSPPREVGAPDQAADTQPPTPDGPPPKLDGPPSQDMAPPADLSPTPDLGPKPDLPGDPKTTCEQLDKLYVQAIQKAKACSPMLPVVHCTVLVKATLICPCPTYVEKKTTELTQLDKQFTALNCAQHFVCPKVPCKVPSGANCKSGGPGGPGGCVDTF